MISIVEHNKDLNRFEISLGESKAFIQYGWYHGDIAFKHTFVPEEFRGRGISDKMISFALNYATENNLKILVLCTAVAKYIKSHPEYKSLINPKYRS